MNTDKIKEKLKESEYDFLRENEHLGKNIILLGLGGSYSYGTNNENSDIDLRGCAVNSRKEILLGRDFEQVTETVTDTTVYSLSKLIPLLLSCNPNTIEILGLNPEHYIYLNDQGRMLLENRKIFLSQKAVRSFGGYADSQFRRMHNLSGRLGDQSLLEEHILRSIERLSETFPEMYAPYPDDAVKLYIDKAVNRELETEIFMDIKLTHYPLRDYKEMWNRMSEIVKDYNRAGKRNQNAVTHKKLGKHMMHLIRLYMMCIDILEKEEIITYRENEHDLLMSIRNGEFLDSDSQPTDDFFALTEEYKKRLEYAKNNTSLPETPDYEKADELVMAINEVTFRV